MNWTELFSLHCDRRDELFTFYLKLKRTIHLLSAEMSATVTDNSFLKAFLAKSTSCEEIQTEAKTLLIDGSEMWFVILDRICADCCAKVNSDSMQTDCM